MNRIIKFFLGIIFLLSLGSGKTFGQNSKIEKLESIVASSNQPKEVVDAYFQLARHYYKKAKAKSIYYLEKAEKICQENQLDSLMCNILFTKGKIYGRHDKDNALKNYRKALTYSKNLDNTYFASKVYNNIGKLYLLINNFDSTEYYFNKSNELKKRLTEQYPDSLTFNKSYGIGLLNLGTMYMGRSEYKRAITLLYSSLEQIEKTKDSTIICHIHLNIGVIHYYYKDYNNALGEFNKAKNIGIKIKDNKTIAGALTNIGAIYKEQKQWDKADSLFTAALIIRLETGPLASVAGLYENLGLIAMKRNHYDEALSYYDKSLEIKKKTNNNDELASLYANMGNLYFLKKNYSQAEKYLLLAKENADISSDLEKSMEIYTSLSRLYETMGEFRKSLSFYKNFKIIDDSIHTLKAEETINLFKEKFKAAEKDKKILAFEQKHKLDTLIQEKQELNNKLLIFGILAIILISISIVLLINNKRKTEKEIFNKNNELNQQKMLELVKEQEMQSVNSFISGQERERTRIASDLHDRLGSLLSTVKLHFSSIEPFFEKDKELSENFSYAISLLDKSVSEVRSVSHNLAKEILTEFGIVGAIENLKEAINSAGNLQLVFINSGYEHRLPYEYEMEIYRIIQELVTNAIKHANASEIVIQFVMDNGNLTITVEDDGIGFNATKINSNGMGLSNIFERTTKINGKYALDTSPGNGTTYIFDIPITSIDK